MVENTTQQSTQEQQQGVCTQPPVQQQPQMNRQQQPQLNQQLQTNPTQATPQPTVPQQPPDPDPQVQYRSPYAGQNQTMAQPNELLSTMHRHYRGSSIADGRTLLFTGIEQQVSTLFNCAKTMRPRMYRFGRNGVKDIDQ